MHIGIVNKTRYDDLRKPMKQISFTVKNIGGNLLEKQFTIVKRNFKSSTKHLFLDSIIPVDELIAKPSTALEPLNSLIYECHPFARIPVCEKLQQLEDVVGCKVLHFINNEDQEVLGYKTLRCKRHSNFL